MQPRSRVISSRLSGSSLTVNLLSSSTLSASLAVVSTIFGSCGRWDGRLQQTVKALVHALTASRRDYCNSLLYPIGLNATATKTLQSVLHFAAPLIMRKRKFERITPTLGDDLHWLPFSWESWVVWETTPLFHEVHCSECQRLRPRWQQTG